MKNITLFVGDCNTDIAKTAQQFDSNAILIDCNNYKQVLQSTHGFTGYTSLADLPKNLAVFCELLDVADSIRYCPPAKWSDGKTIDFENVTTSIQGLTEFYLHAINKIKNNVIGLTLENFKLSPYLTLADTRKTQNAQLWVAGCSTTAGVGVNNVERYGELLGNWLNLPVSFLAEPCSSISWAADQILRSDIKPNDIVVWGLTSENRLTMWDERYHRPVHVNNRSDAVSNTSLSTQSLNKLLVHKTNFFLAIQKVIEVSNFCKKIQAKLLIINIHASVSLALHLIGIEEFFLYTHPSNQPIDIGNDSEHAGPKQHQSYADFCQTALKKLNYI
jgi:hypothetical protein